MLIKHILFIKIPLQHVHFLYFSESISSYSKGYLVEVQSTKKYLKYRQKVKNLEAIQLLCNVEGGGRGVYRLAHISAMKGTVQHY